MDRVIPVKKVELHVHLDGCVRASTAWHLAQKKGISIPGVTNVAEFKSACRCSKPSNLRGFLQHFDVFWPAICGDLDAIERVAFEFCEDAFYAGVVYAEVRYSPALALGDKVLREVGPQGLDEVVVRVARGLRRGEEVFGVRSRTILCAQYSKNFNDLEETLRLCSSHFQDGVVGMDLLTLQPDVGYVDEVPLVEPIVSVFQEAAKRGVHRTVHAAESSGAQSVERNYRPLYDAHPQWSKIRLRHSQKSLDHRGCLICSMGETSGTYVHLAVDHLMTERIGHGYRVVEDQRLYSRCLKERIHFECCPYSSLMTGSVKVEGTNNPIVRFARDGANLSVNSDDPTVTGGFVQQDYELLATWGMTGQQMAQANINAANASFLTEQEKNILLKSL